MSASPGPSCPTPVYPIARPNSEDARFSIGLLLDVAAVLRQHGYPPLRTGPDLTRLQHALFTTIYQQTEETTR